MQPGARRKLSSRRGWSPLVSPCPFWTKPLNPRWLVIPNDDSGVSSSAYPYATLLGGIRGWILRDRLPFPLHRFADQSPQWGTCFTRASRGEELHLYNVQVIKDLSIFAPHPWCCHHFEGTDRTTARYK